MKSLGDGFLATFDGPARAIHCAGAIRDSLHQLDVPVRIGVHTGEVELAEDDVRGIASRVAHIGGADDVLVSRTVKDLVAGSGIKKISACMPPAEMLRIRTNSSRGALSFPSRITLM